MSRRRVYSNDTLAIMDRFFIALDACMQNDLFKTLKEYFEKAEIEPPHFYTQRKDRNRGFFEVGWLVPLIKDCGVSARWLMTGVGSMFAE